MSRVGGYLRWLAGPEIGGTDLGTGDPLTDPVTARRAVREYRSWIESERAAKPTTVNATLTALDHFHAYQGISELESARVDQPAAAPPALSPDELDAFQHAVARRQAVRDRAIALVLVDTGLLASELVALDVPDVRRGTASLIVRHDDVAKRRELPMSPHSEIPLRGWLRERSRWTGSPALFVNRRGGRLSTRWVTELVVAISQAASLDRVVTPALLRRTFATNLLDRGTDPHDVAALMGHKRVQTTNAYRR
ncbi:tyrosine-type recombinase/integrase [Tenggerimyces flavus]|uniref:Tyrosine-type recombinase/integrase n=1 Tax=Tenggerimyces flavus TaxID=1708749 RepID=A0ABV7Y7I8_9ACTN|nr:site-specific integrase [Tenggerimyces flavus]MBM7788347.1 integrase/recombinase XerC [Tenggerimyces flavus]